MYTHTLRSPLAQFMLTIMKDYNHNDSKLFRYLPYTLLSIKLTEEEQSFVNLFNETPIDKIYSLKKG